MNSKKMIRKSLVIFYNDKNVLMQDRRNIPKLGKPYGFFGGSIEEGESPEQAIIREVEEELSIKLKDFKFFKKFVENNDSIDGEWYLFEAKMPNLDEIDVKEGAPVLISFKESLELDISDRDKNMLKLFFDYVKVFENHAI